jgi:hypothetical protein
MRTFATKLLVLVAASVAALTLAAPAFGAPKVDGIFPLKSEIDTNNKIIEGPDGNVWFTLNDSTTEKDVGRITPAGVITEFELKEINGPIGIASGPEGRIWVVGINKAVSFLPSDPEKTEELHSSALIDGSANIALGPGNEFWVASTNKVAKFSPSNFAGTIKEVKVEGGLNPRDIAAAGPGIAIADTEMVGKGSRIVTFTPAGVQKDILIPGASQGVAGGPGGLIGFTAPGAVPEQSGLIPAGGLASSFELTGDPFGIAFGADGAFWIAQFGPPPGLTRVAVDGSHTSLGGIPEATARQITPGPGNTLWVTMQKVAEKSPPAIARVTGVDPPPTPSPGPIPTAPSPPPPAALKTTLGKKPKKVVKTEAKTAKVTFAFSSSIAGSAFECSLGKRVKPKGKKARWAGARFKGCKSPKSYTLKPGRYRFKVRAAVGSSHDQSPPTFGFKVLRVDKG